MLYKHLGRIETIVLILFVFSLPFNNYTFILDRVTPILIICWAIISVIHFFVSKAPLRFNIFFFLLAGYYLLHVIGFFYTEDIDSGILKLESKSSFIIIPILALLSASLYNRRKWYLITFVISNLVATIICLFIAFQNFTFNNLYYTSFSYFMHPSYFALYIVFSMHIVWQLISTEKGMGRLLRWVLFIVLVYFSVMVYLISSKSGIVSGIISVFILLVHEIRTADKKTGRVVFLMLLLAIFVQSAMTNYRFEVFSKKLEKVPTENTHTRFLIWHQATNVIEESFLFGHGTGDAQAVLNVKYLSKGYTEAYKNQLNAHNQYLETTISLGLIGLFVLCLLLIYPFLIQKNKLEILPLMFLFLIAFNLLFESMFERFWGIIFFTFFYSMFFVSKINE